MVQARAMRNSTLLQRALPALLAGCLAAGCGSDSSTTPDRYNGAIDPSGLDAKFTPITSAASTALKALCTGGAPTPCYPAQTGYAHGTPVRFYNVLNAGSAVKTGTVGKSGSLFPLVSTLQTQVFNFPNNCSKGRSIDPRFDAFTFDFQYPVFRSLPLVNTAFGVNVLPLVSLFSVSASGNTCNDIKSADSIDAGDFGAKASPAPVGVQLWAAVDASANFASLTSATTPSPAPVPAQLHQMWIHGLQGSYLDGGKVPVDANGNIVAMNGVILNGATFANAYDNQAVILPAVPGDDGYSPVVNLYQFAMPSGRTLGSYTDICPVGATCAANQVPFGSTTAPFNTIFIVSPQ